MSEKETNKISTPNKAWGKRLLWFVLIWGGSVLALGLVSYSLKLFFSIPH